MRRPDIFMLFIALSCALGACGDCCLSNEPKCNTPPIEPRECVDLRAGTGTSTCTDDFEPNDDLTTAAVSTAGHECEDIDKSGTIADVDDVDVFRTGSCHVGLRVPIFGSIDPRLGPALEITTQLQLRACIFPTCEGGATTIEACQVAPSGTEQWDNIPEVTRTPAGFRGCCRFGTGKVRAIAHCPLDSGELNTFMWVDAGAYSKLKCEPYMLHWNLD